eukprot:TRINITY_DN7317_c0_g1_i1.p1 TRINITY_DN7317_c0_g1~~TRINITY_DN7317_c0_g1_i1.p1  ORF type:complete len:92 (+),score=11.40 TRINITY_DN7317_c0_g1_i1:122-397(+)
MLMYYVFFRLICLVLVMCRVLDDQSDTNPPRPVKTFKAQVFVQDPGKLKCSKNGQGGFTPSVHVRTGAMPKRKPCQVLFGVMEEVVENLET